MAKKYLLGMSVFLLAGLWFISWPEPSADHTAKVEENVIAPSAARILANDKRRLESNLDNEILKNKNWSLVNDYSLEVKKIVNAFNARELFFLNHESANSLYYCLIKDFCGMQRKSDEDPYFDEQRTPAHVLVGRNLEIMFESLQYHPDLAHKINWDMVFKYTDNENEKIQTLALRLIKDFSLGDKATHKLLEIADKYKGSAKGEAFSQIASNNPKDRNVLIEWLLKSFASDDPHSVISILERFKNLSFSNTELEKLSVGLCHFKENGSDDPNWKMIKYYMKPLSDLEKFCN